ncbi:alpha/beta hydrolase [Aquimarina sp. ERC-38]|uniref:alpha/beta fold hydrolase n=1 Tax=Aquimarina sp. ERC-38 TaxID=2949996 RepID=UPI0022458415|nr:alpha/beta hydrolase [Aquimarina sp. ERC-38]UZO80092.1 alpha/beta hydrolase [Aquimarina sp. ERC-38]
MEINKNLIIQKIDPVLTKGDGAITLVFLHYFGGDGGSWLWTIDELSKNYKCISLTLPGFGNTEPLKNKSVVHFAQWIADKLASLKVTNYILCGHSMSGKLALVTATLSTIKPKQLILIAPSPPTVEPMEAEEKERMLHHPAIREAETTVNKVTAKKLSASQKEYAIISQLRIEHETWAWWIKQGMEDNITTLIKDVNIPTTILVGENDPVIDMNLVQTEVLPYMPESQIIVIKDSGHLIPMESISEVASTIHLIASKTNHIPSSH